MSGGGGSETTTSSSSPPPQFLNAYQNLINAATQQSQQPLQQYSGSLIQGFTPDQLQAMTTVENSQGMTQPYINSAAQYAASGATPVTGQQPYMDQATGYGQQGAGVTSMTDPYLEGAASWAGAGANTLGVAQPYMSAAGNYSAAAGENAQNYGAAGGLNAQNYAQAANQGGLSSAGSAVGQAGGLAQGAVGAAGTNVYGSLPQFSQQSVQQYMSPYTQDVVNSTQAEFNNQNQQQSAQLQGSAVSAGAYGGDREAVAQAELANQQQLAQAPTIAGLENSGYQTAANQFQTEQQLQAQTESQQASLEASTGLGAANTALQGGNLGLSAALGGGQLGESASLGAGQLGESAALGAGQLGANTQLGEAGLAGQDYLSGANLGAQTSLGIANTLGSQYLQGTGQGLQSAESNAQLAGNLGISQDYLNANAGYEMASLGNEAQNSALTGASAEMGTGSLQQQMGQEQLNLPYEQFEQQQAYPYQQLNWLGGLTEGAGSLSGGTSTTSSPDNSAESGLMGLGEMGAAALMFMNKGGRVHRDAGGGIPDPSQPFIPNATAGTRGAGPPHPVSAPKESGGLSSMMNPMTAMSMAKAAGGSGSADTSAQRINGPSVGQQVGNYLGTNGTGTGLWNQMTNTGEYSTVPTAVNTDSVDAMAPMSLGSDAVDSIPAFSDMGDMGDLGDLGALAMAAKRGGRTKAYAGGAMLPIAQSGVEQPAQATNNAPNAPTATAPTFPQHNGVVQSPVAQSGPGNIVPGTGGMQGMTGGSQQMSTGNPAPTPSMQPMTGGGGPQMSTGSPAPAAPSAATQYMLTMLGQGQGQAQPQSAPPQITSGGPVTAPWPPAAQAPSQAILSPGRQQVPLAQQMQPGSGGLTQPPASAAPTLGQQQARPPQWQAPRTPVFDPTNYANNMSANGSQNSTGAAGVSQINQPTQSGGYQRPQFNIGQLMQQYPGLFGGSGFQGLGAFGQGGYGNMGLQTGAFARGGHVHRAAGGGGLSAGATPQQQGASPAAAAMAQQYQSMSLQQLQQASAMASPGSSQAQAIQYALATKLSHPATQITVNQPQAQAQQQQTAMATGGTAPGSGGAVGLKGPTGIATPQVSASTFSGINPALSGGPTGLGSISNPLPQYLPPGTDTSNGGLVFPHTTMQLPASVLGNLRGTKPPLTNPGAIQGSRGNPNPTLSKVGGRIHRADGGDNPPVDPTGDIDPAPPVDLQVSPTAGTATASDIESMTGHRGGGGDTGGLSTPSLFGAPPRMSNADAADAGKGLAAAGAPGATPTPQAPASQINAGGLNAAAPPAQAQQQKGHWLDEWSPPAQDKSNSLPMALMMAGAATMAGHSRHPMQNIGAGAMAGIQEYQKQLGADDKPIVDHSGDSIRIYYPSEKKWFDTGMPTEAALSRQSTNSYQTGLLANDTAKTKISQQQADQTGQADKDRNTLGYAQLANTSSNEAAQRALQEKQFNQSSGKMTMMPELIEQPDPANPGKTIQGHQYVNPDHPDQNSVFAPLGGTAVAKPTANGPGAKGWTLLKDDQGNEYRTNANDPTQPFQKFNAATSAWETANEVPDSLSKFGSVIGGAMNQRFSNRVAGASNEGLSALASVAGMGDPNSGAFGQNRATGMFGAAAENWIAGNLTPDRVKMYNATIAGLAPEIATAQNQGMAANDTQINHIEQAITIGPTDSPQVAQYKVALGARYLDKALEVNMTTAQPDTKKQMQGMRDRLGQFPDPDAILAAKGPGMFPGRTNVGKAAPPKQPGQEQSGMPVPPKPLAGIQGLEWSASRKQFRDPSSGKVYDATGAAQ